MKNTDDPIAFLYTIPYRIFVFCLMIPAGVALIIKGYHGVKQGYIIGVIMLVLQIPWLRGLKERYDKDREKSDD